MTAAKKQRHALASSASAEHYTQEWLVEASRRVMGSIDVDPCSCEVAQQTVKATVYYTRETNGLAHEWHGNAFINAPGTCQDEEGRFLGCGDLVPTKGGGTKKRISCSCHLPGAFFEHLGCQWTVRRVKTFVWVAFNISHMRMLQSYDRWLLAGCSVFFPAERFRFTGDSPTKDNAVLYRGPHRDRFRRVMVGSAPGGGVVYHPW